ncbi:MAG: right-handed parallel beta-helix repeat-containing protein [Candidatus Eisenbacteria bacterium]
MKRCLCVLFAAILCQALAFASVSARVRAVPSEYETIQKAIDAAAAGDTVLVAPGTYKENLVLTYKAVSLISSKGAQKTVVDAGRRDIALRCYMVDSTATIQGFTFKNGQGMHGGGVFLSVSSPRVIDNVFTADSATYGGGLCVMWSNSVIEGNTFVDNRASYGGGLYTMFLAPKIDSNLIANNRAEIGGGLYFARSSEARARGNVISGNRAQRGGGMIINTASPIIEQSLLENNEAKEDGGAILSLESQGLISGNIMARNRASMGGALALGDTVAPDVENNTIVFNSAPDSVCAGIYCATPVVNVRRNILSFNSPGFAFYCVPGVSPVVACNIFWKNETGDYFGLAVKAEDIYMDPLFCNADKSDFNVREDSPALNPLCGTIGAREKGCKAGRGR